MLHLLSYVPVIIIIPLLCIHTAASSFDDRSFFPNIILPVLMFLIIPLISINLFSNIFITFLVSLL
jgi:hypothetical protein